MHRWPRATRPGPSARRRGSTTTRQIRRVKTTSGCLRRPYSLLPDLLFRRIPVSRLDNRRGGFFGRDIDQKSAVGGYGVSWTRPGAEPYHRVWNRTDGVPGTNVVPDAWTETAIKLAS